MVVAQRWLLGGVLRKATEALSQWSLLKPRSSCTRKLSANHSSPSRLFRLLQRCFHNRRATCNALANVMLLYQSTHAVATVVGHCLCSFLRGTSLLESSLGALASQFVEVLNTPACTHALPTMCPGFKPTCLMLWLGPGQCPQPRRRCLRLRRHRLHIRGVNVQALRLGVSAARLT